MCGITGIWQLDHTKISREKLSRFNNSLSHRGPDGSELFIENSVNLGLGHRRLSILDLSDMGTQPMSYLNNQYWIVFNGEIYNFLELRQKLISFGYKFKTDTDTEVILAAFDKWGEKCVEHFNGMWAFAIWDTKKKNIFLARDRFGIKPLYYLFIPNKIFAFASETIAFKYLDGYKRELDQKTLGLAIKDPFSLEGYGHTIYKNINQLLPGHFLKLQASDQYPKQRRWWSTLNNLRENLPEKYTDRVKEFLSIFEDSCKLRMRSDVPIGTALSGGIDSSAVYSTISKIMREAQVERSPQNWQQAFIGVFENTEYDEKKYADLVIEHTKGRAVYIEQDFSKITDEIILSTKQFDNIYVSPISVVANIYRAMRENGVKVSLDGHGVDEMLFGYRSLYEEARKFVTANPSRFNIDEIFSENGSTFTNQNEENLISKIKKQIKSKLSTDSVALFRKLLNKKDYVNPLPYLGESDPKENNLNHLEKIVYDTFHKRTLPTILRNFDRASMQSGTEVRMPFMDWRLVTFIFSLPLEDKIYDGFSKRILRDSMKNIMPEEIRTRKLKIGLNAPMIEWFKGPLKPFLIDITNSIKFQEAAGTDFQKIKKMVEVNLANDSWTWQDCATLWPYINVTLILNRNK